MPLRSALVALAAGASLALGACTPAAPSSTGGAGEALAIVASTNVYGDLAKAVGGDRVSVTSIVSKTTQDPHSYEATAQDRLAVSKAKLVIENGGGYDPFLHTLADEAKISHENVVTAVEVAGLETADAHAGESATASPAEGDGHGHAAFNEHVWYDVAAMGKVVDAIATRLSALDPGSATAFAERAKGITGKLTAIEARLAEMAKSSEGAKAAVTEPVPHYLLEAAGLEDATPEAFTEAIEEEQDVPPAALKETLDLVSGRHVAVLAYNPQTAGPQTEQVRKAAEAAGVPVVEFTETLPEGMDYATWMQSNVDALAKGLA